MFDKKPHTKPTIRQMELFHEANLYIPTRTVYFGGDIFNEDEVTSMSVAQVIKNLQILEYQNPGEKITLVLNSCGGSWYAGIALYDVIKALKSPVIIIGVGQIFSMASIILQAGYKRVLTKYTTLMIHDGCDGYIGDPKAFEAWAKQSKITRKQSYEIYKERMIKKNQKITLKQIEKMCSFDYIMGAEEAVNVGLADTIMDYVTKKG